MICVHKVWKLIGNNYDVTVKPKKEDILVLEVVWRSCTFWRSIHILFRYTIILENVWKILENLVPNLVKPLQFYVSDRRGRLCSVSQGLPNSAVGKRVGLGNFERAG